MTSAGTAPRPLVLGLGWFPNQANGLNRYLRSLTDALADGDGEPPRVVVVGPADDAPPWVDAVTDGHHRFLPWRLFRFAQAAAKAAPGTTLVDSHFALFSAAAMLVPSVRRKPLVVHFQGPWADESVVSGERGTGRIGAKRLVERWVYRRADAAVVLSTAFKRILVEGYGVSPWRVHVMPPGVDLDHFSPGIRADARSRLGVDQTAWVAMASRRLVPRTGIDVLLQAWATVEGDDRVLLVVGDGPDRAALEAEAQRLGLVGRVRFLGHVPDQDLVAAYRAADLSIVPSVALEGYGLVVLESLACGTPVMASDAGGLAEALVPLDPALVVPAGSATAITTRLNEIRRGDHALPSWERCRTFAESQAWPRVASRHNDLYRSVMSGAGSERPRVVFLDHTAQPSGGELSLLRLLPCLDGVDTHVVLATDGPLVGRLEAAGVSVEVLPMPEAARDLARSEVKASRLPAASALGTATYVLRMARRLRKLRPDLVHTYSLKAAIYGGLAGRLARVPVVWHIHDRVADDYLPSSAVRLIHRLSRRIPHAVIVNSEASAATLPHGPTPVVVPEPVPSSRLGDRSPRPSTTPLRVGLMGRVCPWKGQDLFLRAFARAFAGDDAEAAIIGGPLFGEDDYERELMELADRLGVGSRVHFLGHVEDVETELARLDVLVHASVIPEPFGMVVVEGMAAGLPVIAAGAGGPVEVIDDGVNGLLYPMGDEQALAAALRRLADDPALRTSLGKAAVVRARDYRPEVLAPTVLKVYDEVLTTSA